ncbi:hypothetical protein DMUE_5147, partial [Dictyocoela muelleri]
MVSIFSYDCDLFKNIESLLKYLLDHEIILPQRQCRKCDQIGKITIYKCNDKQRIIYRCTNILCKTKNSLYNTKISLHRYIFLTYCLYIDLNYTQIKLLIPKISDHTIALARKK